MSDLTHAPPFDADVRAATDAAAAASAISATPDDGWVPGGPRSVAAARDTARAVTEPAATVALEVSATVDPHDAHDSATSARHDDGYDTHDAHDGHDGRHDAADADDHDAVPATADDAPPADAAAHEEPVATHDAAHDADGAAPHVE